ncbi:MAG: hypothetical protein HF973_19455 [Chloroflexi bacterium]|nr:hypothetical protein [Chloroflexota bacterium]
MEMVADFPQKAFRYQTEVTQQGRIELPVALSPGARVTIFVIEEGVDTFDDLLQASESSLDFWDNPLDDKDWNNA